MTNIYVNQVVVTSACDRRVSHILVAVIHMAGSGFVCFSTVQGKNGPSNQRSLKVRIFDGFYDLLTEPRHFINRIRAEPGYSFSELRDAS